MNEYKCDLCPWEGTHWSNFLIHRRQRHPLCGVPNAVVVRKPNTVKSLDDCDRVECPYCGRSFGNEDLMLTHAPTCGRHEFEAHVVRRSVSDEALKQLEHELAFEMWCAREGRP